MYQHHALPRWLHETEYVTDEDIRAFLSVFTTKSSDAFQCLRRWPRPIYSVYATYVCHLCMPSGTRLLSRLWAGYETFGFQLGMCGRLHFIKS